MELKYYLRGLGLGIVITAIIMGIVTSKNKTMTNEEIIARAKQLGMIEDTVLTNINSKGEDDGQESEPLGEENAESGKEALPKTQPSALEGDTSNDNLQDNPQDNSVDDSLEADARVTDTPADERRTDSGVDAEAGDSEKGESEANTAAPSETMVITIGKGDGSYSASKKLADVGAVPSAADFDTFLCENGYDKKIRAGTYTIPADASEEQMARIITGIE